MRLRIKSAMTVEGESRVVRFPSGMELLLFGTTRRPEPLPARNRYLPPLIALCTPPFPKGISFTGCGNAYPSLGWAGRRGRRAGKRSQGMAKRLTFTERRLSFTFGEGTPRPESQAFRQPRGEPMEAALIFRLLFIKEKEGKMTQP